MAQKQERDSVYILKLVLYFILGTVWLKFTVNDLALGIPVGFILGIIFAAHDHFQVDRKIEYAVLLVSTILSYIAPIGIIL